MVAEPLAVSWDRTVVAETEMDSHLRLDAQRFDLLFGAPNVKVHKILNGCV